MIITLVFLTLNASLTDTETTSLIGSGTKTFSIPSTRKRLTIITKKSNVIVGAKEIPTNVLENGDIINLGATAPIIGTDKVYNSALLDNNLVGEELYAARGINVATGMYAGTPVGKVNGGTALASNKQIGLATDLSNTNTAILTFNGNNSFTIEVTDSALSVYVY